MRASSSPRVARGSDMRPGQARTAPQIQVDLRPDPFTLEIRLALVRALNGDAGNI